MLSHSNEKTSHRNITAALVGFGSVASNAHLPWFFSHPNVSLAAIVEPSPGGRDLAQSLCPDIPVFEDLKSLLCSSDITFVDITTPPLAHEKLILTALESGIDVFCEKPFVTNLQALQKIERARQLSGAVVASCHNWYFSPPIRRGLEMIDSGLIGQPKYFQLDLRRYRSAQGALHWAPAWREFASEGGGIIRDLGYHGIYLASRIFQSTPRSVSTDVIRMADTDDGVERYATLQLNYNAERKAQLNLSWMDRVRQTKLRVDGESGSIIVSDNSVVMTDLDNRKHEERFEATIDDSWHAAWTSECLNRFVETIHSRKDEENWLDILCCVATLDAAYVSSKSRISEPISLSCKASHAELPQRRL